VTCVLPEIPTPCVGVCRLDPATGLCQGCLRSGAEIAAWGSASNELRLEIVQRLRERRRAQGITSWADQRPRRRGRVAIGRSRV
jgi:predicted Fe-S protein YdhL (DUF1289 family)